MSSKKPDREPRNRRCRWTLSELRYVEAHYGTVPATVIAAHLGRPVSSVRMIARNLGVAGAPSVLWTAEEDAVLYTLYAQGAPMAEVMARLPGRRQNALCFRARKLGIYRPGRWLQEEMRILRTYYPSEGMAVSRRLPGRTPKQVESARYRLARWKIRHGDTPPVLRYPHKENQGVTVSLPVHDCKASLLDAAGLWRRAATRWLEVMLQPGLTNGQREWISSRRRYCCTRLPGVPEPLDIMATCRAAAAAQKRMNKKRRQ